MLFLPSRLAQRLSCAAVQRCSGSPLRAASARYGRFAASWWFRECVCRGSETCLDHAKLEICRRRLLVSCKTLGMHGRLTRPICAAATTARTRRSRTREGGGLSWGRAKTRDLGADRAIWLPNHLRTARTE